MTGRTSRQLVAILIVCGVTACTRSDGGNVVAASPLVPMSITRQGASDCDLIITEHLTGRRWNPYCANANTATGDTPCASIRAQSVAVWNDRSISACTYPGTGELLLYRERTLTTRVQSKDSSGTPVHYDACTSVVVTLESDTASGQRLVHVRRAVDGMPSLGRISTSARASSPGSGSPARTERVIVDSDRLGRLAVTTSGGDTVLMLTRLGCGGTEPIEAGIIVVRHPSSTSADARFSTNAPLAGIRIEGAEGLRLYTMPTSSSITIVDCVDRRCRDKNTFPTFAPIIGAISCGDRVCVLTSRDSTSISARRYE
jgi:hypothetical protein